MISYLLIINIRKIILNIINLTLFKLQEITSINWKIIPIIDIKIIYTQTIFIIIFQPQIKNIHSKLDKKEIIAVEIIRNQIIKQQPHLSLI
jgi:hypothetical protein